MVTAVPLVECAAHVEGQTPALPAAAAKRFLRLPGVLRLGIRPRAFIPGRGAPVPGGMTYKIGVSVNAGNPGRSVRLTVREPTALLVYPGATGTSIRLRACPPGHPRFRDGLPIGAWTAWPGGITVSEPMCVHLLVRSGSRTFELALGLGAQCP